MLSKFSTTVGAKKYQPQRINSFLATDRPLCMAGAKPIKNENVWIQPKYKKNTKRKIKYK